MLIFCENWAWVHQYADPGRGKSWWGPESWPQDPTGIDATGLTRRPPPSIGPCCQQWRLKPSVSKTVASVLHLHNTSANRQLNVLMNGQRLAFDLEPVIRAYSRHVAGGGNSPQKFWIPLRKSAMAIFHSWTQISNLYKMLSFHRWVKLYLLTF